MPRPAFLALTLPLLWWALPTRAAAVDVNALARSPKNNTALRLIVQPPEGTDSSSVVIATLGDDGPNMELHNDGKGVDRVADDDTWVGELDSPPPAGDVLFTLSSADGQLLWSDVIPVDTRLTEPWVSLTFTDARVVVSVGGSDTLGEGAAPGDDGTPAGNIGTLGDFDPARPEGRPKPAGSWMWLIVAGLFGAIAGWFLRGRRRLRLPPPVAVQDAPAHPGSVTELPRDRLDDVIADRARQGQVLVVPTTARRETWQTLAEGLPVVRWLLVDRPTSRHIRKARRALLAVGPTTLVVDGLDALERPDDDEPADAVLQELVDDGDGEILLVVEPAQGDPLIRGDSA